MKIKTILKYLHPKYLRLHSRGFCPVCAHNSVFIFTDDVKLIRNNAVCIKCHSVSRHRGIALCILDSFSQQGIKQLSDFRSLRHIKVLNTSSKSPIAAALGSAPNIFNTEFFDDIPAGSFKNDIMCQDLENLTFENNNIDLVISEDVFEHVKDFTNGFKEVYRVLKKDGFHIFTIPFFFDNKTKNLFRKEDNNKYIPIVLPIEYHGDGIREKIPTYTHLGYDLLDILADIGFKTKIHISEYHEYTKFGTFNCFTFISQKC